MSPKARLLTPARRDALGGGVAIACVIVVTLWALHPGLLLANTTTTGGDTGAHVALPWYLREHLVPSLRLTGWYPGWFDGMPLYTYYFVLSDLVAAVASYVIPYGVAFKLATVLGSLLLPLCAYAMGRLFELRAPLPACLAAATLPFLFETSYTIDGGNLFSTLAGEYAFSLGLALSLVAMGLFARGLRTGRGVVLTASMLALTLAAHVLPWLWAAAGIAVLVVLDLLAARLGISDPMPARPPASAPTILWFAAKTGGLALALSAWWLLPWITSQSYAISMGYVNDGTPGQPSFLTHLFPGGDRVMFALALAGLGTAVARRSRFGIWISTLTVVAAIAYVLDPQGAVWNERLLPFWFFGAWLTCAWLFGIAAAAIARRYRERSLQTWIAHVHSGSSVPARRPRAAAGFPAALAGALCAGGAVLALVLPPMTTLVPRSLLNSINIHPGANQVPVWAAYNYTGYEGVAGWPHSDKNWSEYHAVIQMMRRAGETRGCGQSMWEYAFGEEGSFGTPESLMLLPYWTDNCIGSMEGLLFESSATTPYHFLNQSELSVGPSNPMVGLPYNPTGAPQVHLGLEHLGMLGVRYFLAFSPRVVDAARRDPLVRVIDRTGPWTYQGRTTTWTLFELRDHRTVVPLTMAPNVVTSLGSRDAWQEANVTWWLDPSRWGVLLAQSGPGSWPRVASPKHAVTRALAPVVVSDERRTLTTIGFHVDKVGTPVLIKTSYYPRWHATGADGPYRVSPNLMVVVPTSRDVLLSYGSSPMTTVGGAISLASVAGAAGVACMTAVRRRRGATDSR